MPSLQIYLFGAPQVERDGHSINITRRRTIALLAYLAATGRAQSRDLLATLLWPEHDQSSARANLRRELSRLRNALGEEVVAADRSQAAIEASADYWLDVAAFRSHLELVQAHDHFPQQACTPCLNACQAAVSLYTADFLAGFSLPDSPQFDEWQFFQTESLRSALADVLQKLIQWYANQRDYQAAIKHGRRWLALDNLNEPAHRQLMRLYAWAGQHAASLRQYAEAVRILEDELGVEPESETTALYEEIRTRQITPRPQPRGEAQAARPTPAPRIRYQVESLLAVGGHGEVYRGRDLIAGTNVVIKRLRPELLQAEPEYMARFLREGEILRQLDHPNIVQFLGTFEQDGQTHLVMEYVPGGSLRQLLDSEPRLSPDHAINLTLELADALSRAHHLGVVHRDIKPENILLAENGTPRLTDFGIASLESGDARITHAGSLLGSPSYMSPEALQSIPLDARSDIWSLGAVLYEMLAGEPPFGNAQIATTLLRIMQEPPPDLLRKQPDTPASLDQLVRRMLVKERDKRISSMRRVAAALEAIRDNIEPDLEQYGRSPLPITQAVPEAEVERQRTATDSIHLPTQPTPLAGRRQDVAQIRQLLAEEAACRLLTLVGPGGIGKSRLAIAAGALLSDSFADGVYFVPVRGRSSAAEIAPAIAGALALQFAAAATPKIQLLHYLRGKQLLLIIDDLERQPDNEELLITILNYAPGVKLLVTSPEQPRLQEAWSYEVQGLSWPDQVPVEAAGLADFGACQLFLQRAGRADARFKVGQTDIPAVVEICRLLDGMPLSLELAAAWVRDRPLAQIADEISRSLELQSAVEPVLPDFHPGLRVVLRLAWERLPAGDQNVLSSLSVFRGGFSLGAAEAVVDGSTDTLARLLDHALLCRNSDGRYSLPEPIRRFAAVQLESNPEVVADLLDRHGDYYMAFLARSIEGLKGGRQKAITDDISSDIDNIRAAWRLAVDRCQTSALVKAAQSFWLYSELSGCLNEGESAFRDAIGDLSAQLEQSGAEPDSRIGFLRVGLGNLMAKRGWLDEGMAMMAAGVEQFRQAASPDLSRVAFSLAQLAWGLVMQSQYDEANRYAQESLGLFPETNDHWTRALGLWVQGMALQYSGRLDEAETSLTACLTTTAQIDEQRIQLKSRQHLGQIALLRGDTARAGQLFDEAMALNEQAGDRLEQADLLRDQGLLAVIQADHERAADRLEGSRSILREIGRVDNGLTACYLGILRQQQGEYGNASQLFQDSLAAANAAGDHAAAATVLKQMGMLAYEQGVLGLAEQRLQESLAYWQQINHEPMISAATSSLGHVLAVSAESRHGEAQQQYRQALKLALKHRLAPVALDVMAGAASLLIRTGNIRRGVHLLHLAEQHPASTHPTRAIARGQLAALSAEVSWTGPLTGELTDWQETAITLVAELEAAGFESLQVPNNLPEESSSLVGRKREISEVGQRLARKHRQRLLTLTGPAGVGKTRLALAVAHQLASHFPAGVFFLSLAPFTAEAQVVVRLADMVGLRFHEQGEPLTQLIAYLGDRQMLLVLDDFEHFPASASLVAQILGGTSHVQILAISPLPLNQHDEEVYELPGLAYPQTEDLDAAGQFDAVNLFLRQSSLSISQLEQQPNDLEAIVHCCRLVEGMPLAIIMAAAWIKELSPPEIVSTVERHLKEWDSEVQPRLARQQSLEAVLTIAWDRLATMQRQALGKLSLFPGGFTWTAAEGVAAISRRQLLALSSQAWLQREGRNHLRMHGPLRQFVQGKMTAAADAEVQARQAYLQYYLDLMRQQHERMNRPEQVEAFATVAAEFDNTRLAWEWLLDAGKVSTVVEDLLPALFRYSESRQSAADLKPLLEAAGDQLHQQNSVSVETKRSLAIVLTAQSAFYGTGFPIRFEPFGMVPAADVALIRRAWQTANEGELLPQMGFWGAILSSVYGRIVNRRAGAAELRRLVSQFRESNRRWLLGLSLQFLAQLLLLDHDDTSHFAEIEACIDEALALFQAAGDKRESGFVLRALGQLRRLQHCFDEAIGHWQAAQAKLQATGDRRLAADIYWAMGDAYLQIGRHDDAFRSYRKMSRVYLEMGIARIAAEILSKESFEAARYSDLDHAMQARQQSLALSREMGDALAEAWSLWELGEIYRVMGELEKARHWYENARQMFDEFDDRSAYAFYHRGLGDIDYCQGDYWEAQEQFWHSLEFAREASLDWSIAYARAGLGKVSLALGQHEAAREHLARSLERGIKANEQGIILVTLANIAEWFAAAGDKEQALTLVSLVRQHHASWRETKDNVEKLWTALAPRPEQLATTAQRPPLDVWQTASDILFSLEQSSTWQPAGVTGQSLLDRSKSTQNLPVSRSPFVGREKEVADIRHYLLEARRRLVTLVGPGGIGKTRLAIESAASSSAQFENGVYYVALAPLESAAQIAAALAECLGFHNFSGEDPKRQALDYLHNKRALLVLDNYEHLLPDTSLIDEILDRAPQVQILVTTRQRLNLGEEAVYPLSGMPYPQESSPRGDELGSYASVQLLLAQARLVRPDYEFQPEDAEHVVRICQMVEGIPLALVLAAGWLEMLSFAEIAEEIERSLDFLESERRDLPERQRSMRAVFDGSWSRLASTARQVMARLAVFPGGFTRQAAKAVSAADLRTLRTLVNSSFITVASSGRYEIHELLRQYCLERLEAMGETDATRDRHTAYFLSFLQDREADLKGKRQPEALEEIENELRNVRVAWNWASRKKQRALIDGAAEALHLFCDLRGRHQEGAALFSYAREQLAPLPGEEPEPGWTRIILRHAFLRTFNLSQPEGLPEDLEWGLALAQKQANQLEIAIAHQALGTLTYTVRQDPVTAMAHFEESYAIFRELDDPFFMARSMMGIGFCYAISADPVRSEEITREALDLILRIGSKMDASIALANLAEIELGQGKYEQAERSFRQAMDIGEALQSAIVRAYCRPFSNLITLLRGDLAAAESEIKAGLRLAEEINYVIAIAYGQAILGLYEGIAGNAESSQLWAQKSLDNPGNNSMGLIVAPWGLAIAHCDQGQWPEAEIALANAFVEADKNMYAAPLLWLLPVAALLAAKRGLPEPATQFLALAFTHPLTAIGWVKSWTPLDGLQSNLEEKLGTKAFKHAWDQGKEIAVENVSAMVRSILQPDREELGRAPTDKKRK